jgi:serine/threonine protein kinase
MPEALWIVHRDLKPENCVLDARGTVKIVDFGLAARFVPGELLHDFCGSSEYAAPEVLRQHPHEGPPIDTWALGVMLFDMVMGHLPFGAESLSFDSFELDATLTPELQLLLVRVLQEDPKKRAGVKELKACEWMRLLARWAENAELELMPSTTTTPSMSLPHDSPLKQRVSLERMKLLHWEMASTSIDFNN